MVVSVTLISYLCFLVLIYRRPTFTRFLHRLRSLLQSEDIAEVFHRNIGLNYYTWRPSLGLTYLNKTGQEVSFNLGGFVNSQNQATGYKSGSEFYAGYAFEQFLLPKFALGIGGYYYKQISDDKLHGKTVDAISAADILNGGPGNRGEAFAIGPIISYNPSNSMVFEAHWDHEVLAYNRDQREIIYARGTIKF